jgi:ADP-ribose pyrophosphatase
MRKTLYEGRFVRLVDEDGWEFADRVTTDEVVCIVAIDGGHVLLVEEYRRPVQAPVISIPAGLVDRALAGHSETGIEAALRELREETGYAARSIEEVVSGPISAGMTTERVTFFLAHDLKAGPQMLDEGESIKVHRVPLPQLATFLAECSERGAQIDPKIFAGLYFAKTRGLTGDAPQWWKGLRARVTRIRRRERGDAQELDSHRPHADVEDDAVGLAAPKPPASGDALARLGRVLNWIGLTIGFLCGAWVLLCAAALFGVFGYIDAVSTGVLLIVGVVVGFFAWLAGRVALYIFAGH